MVSASSYLPSDEKGREGKGREGKRREESEKRGKMKREKRELDQVNPTCTDQVSWRSNSMHTQNTRNNGTHKRKK